MHTIYDMTVHLLKISGLQRSETTIAMVYNFYSPGNMNRSKEKKIETRIEIIVIQTL
jgi:collagenase-like PrtC family protease